MVKHGAPLKLLKWEEKPAVRKCKTAVLVYSDNRVPILGKNLVIADALSRAQSTPDKFDEVLGQEATVRINLLTQASPTKWEEIAKMTTDDPEMQDVLFHINNGWPEKRKTKIAVQPYWH
ncbi:uncharacterized protein K02A2.6 [Trichonephila clavata]|uniref:Uncharacterized protein K02A2.6 n=1 Tax=Trichonephila clavata TaxID=2740835 RepID=A0A8X6LVQ0_TRICU|nr:uncharacterized protein K02A2.6 [Trichonephila clavata]